MRYSVLLWGLIFVWSGCALSEKQQDADFDDFYEGSPQDFQPAEKTPATGGFEFSGGNEEFQCTVTCTPR